jgi:hypothetical protein
MRMDGSRHQLDSDFIVDSEENKVKNLNSKIKNHVFFSEELNTLSKKPVSNLKAFSTTFFRAVRP